MKWKNRLTNYNFWISIVSATLLILQAFNIKLDIANINEIVTALLGLLVVIGIINDPTKSGKETENAKEKTTSNTLKNKHKGCEKANADAGQNADQITQIDGALVGDDLPLTENESNTNSVENSGEEQAACPACEEIENTKIGQSDLQQNAESQTDQEQYLTGLNNQTISDVVEGEIPSAKQNETDFNLAENDLQVLINQISMDIKNKYAELDKLAESLNFAANKKENDNTTSVENKKEDVGIFEKDLNTKTDSKDLDAESQVLPQGQPNQADDYDLNCDNQATKENQNNLDFELENLQNNIDHQPEMPTHFNIVN